MSDENVIEEYVYDAENITRENLTGKSIMVATPMYGGVCNSNYTKSCIDLAIRAALNGIAINFYFIANESLITRGRNYCARMFMKSDATHLMFIDADIGFDPGSVFELLHACDHEQGRGIIGGLYPKKSVAWEKVQQAASMGVGAENPHDLSRYAGDMVYNPDASVTQITLNKPFRVSELGTGFMMIDKKALELYVEERPDRLMTPDHIRDAEFNGDHQITAFFNTYICPKTNRYLSEDYAFCHEMRDLGVGVWACPWINLSHQGAMTFEGSLPHMLALGQALSADPDQVARMTKPQKPKRTPKTAPRKNKK